MRGEQLKLFESRPPDVSPAANPSFHELSRKERLSSLLEGKLDFQGEDTGYASHSFHAFAAKFPPQLPRLFIRALSEPGQTVLDPMMGSGTTLVESFILGRNVIGVDLDPLAVRLGSSKTTWLDPVSTHSAATAVIERAFELLDDKKNLNRLFEASFDPQTKSFVDYWFLPETQRELMALSAAIKEVKDFRVRRFLELTFSSIIITKSGGVSLARDLAHSRPHRVEDKKPRGALDQFFLRLKKNYAAMHQLPAGAIKAAVVMGDARSLPLADRSVDLIVTSPPYANAIDYMRAHKFSLVWLGDSVSRLSEKRAEYIGSERVGDLNGRSLPENVERTIEKLSKMDQRKSAVVKKYFLDMRASQEEMHRVLRPGCAAVLVVGTSTMRGMDVQTHTHLAEIAKDVGFEVSGVAARAIDRNRRMMPARFGKNKESQIEQRMHEEYVIGLHKP